MNKNLINKFLAEDNVCDQTWSFIKTKFSNIYILRFLAALLVITIHTISEFQLGIFKLSTITYGFQWYTTFLYVFCKPCVDIFLICTGISSFNKKKNNWKKYWTILVGFYFINIISEIYNIVHWDSKVLLSLFLPVIFANGRLWFFRVYFIFTPLIPYLNKIINSMKSSIIFIGLVLFISLLQYIPSNDFPQPYMSFANDGYSFLQFILMFLWGRSIIIVYVQLNLKHWYYHLLSLFMIASSYITFMFAGVKTSYGCTIIILNASFIIMSMISMNIKQNFLSNWICNLGKLSFWFYAVDAIYNQFTPWSLTMLTINAINNPNLQCYLWIINSSLAVIFFSLYLIVKKLFTHINNKRTQVNT